jgi:N-acetylglucosamine-6-sulfatase
MRPMSGRRAALTVALAAAIVAAAAGGWALGSAGKASPRGPSVVIILTDDQRWDTLSAMPNVRRLLAGPGVTFANAFVVNSLCCPSRASFLTGEYSHSTGIYTEAPPHGGYRRFRDGSTVATWLHAAGYHTGLFGKYLNGYTGTAIPPGWDRWFAFEQAATGYYQRYQVNDDGAIERFGSAPQDYSTDVLASQAVSFIDHTRGPLFAYVAPYAPHAPAVPAPRDRSAPVRLSAFDPPSFDERDMGDKPAWMRSLPKVSRTEVDAFRTQQVRSLIDVDRMVGAIVGALRRTGRLHDTLIAFTSDQGLGWGEHRWFERKEVPYEESIRIPDVLRFDPLVRTPHTDRHLVLNIDLAPTIAALAGVSAPGVDGRSVVPLLADRAVPWRHAFLIEHVEGTTPPDPPTYCAARTERYLFVRYATGERELYDLRTDPFELSNAAGEPRMRTTQKALANELAQLCRPPPPGLSNP